MKNHLYENDDIHIRGQIPDQYSLSHALSLNDFCHPRLRPEMEPVVFDRIAEHRVRAAPRHVGRIVLSALDGKREVLNVALP